jgi:hypothetical protein
MVERGLPAIRSVEGGSRTPACPGNCRLNKRIEFVCNRNTIVGRMTINRVRSL